jgi:A/G-specific adenine glycosylase
MEIRDKIREWYLGNKRQLPWRNIMDPYRIWVSEIILQQTRINQGMKYYHNFLNNFPNLESLASASEDEVLKVWEGLGYYSRARNMHSAAKYLVKNNHGKFPDSFSGLMEMKGVGSYTAAAISSIAFNEPRAVVDGNVNRVISRLFGIAELPSGYRSPSRIVSMAEEILDLENPGTHNQAVMELGALVCTPLSPKCPSCPVIRNCIAFKKDRIMDLPLRARPVVKRIRYFHYIVILDDHGTWLGRRMAKDIWQGLWEFPLIETKGNVSVESMIRSTEWAAFVGAGTHPDQVSDLVRHQLSHQEILARFYTINTEHHKSRDGYESVRNEKLDHYPVPKLIGNYLKKNII